MKDLIEEAFRVALHIEKRSHELYVVSAAQLRDCGGCQIFDRLAHEESKVIDEMRKHAPATLPESGREPHEQHRSYLNRCVDGPPERMLFDHLRLALLDKHAGIEHYTAFVETLREPALRRVFERAQVMSQKLYKQIAAEYRQADSILHRPGVNRRARRVHIRAGNHPTPNKHSQLYFSLLDFGRRSPFSG
jgi:rubrerythrin